MDSLSLSLSGSAAQQSQQRHARPPFGRRRGRKPYRKLDANGSVLKKRRDGSFSSQICISKANIQWLGIFDSEEKAVLAYKEAARSLREPTAAPPLSHALGVPAFVAPAAPPPPSAVRLECMGFQRERRDEEESAVMVGTRGVKKPFLFDLNLPAPS